MASHSGEDNNSQCVNDVHLQELASKLGKEWKTVGRHLGLTEAEIDQAKCNNSQNVQEAIYSVLQTWKRKTASGATYSVLAQHLEKAKRKDLAEEVLQWWDVQPQKNIGNPSELFIKALKRTYEKWLSMIRPNPTKKSQKWKLNDLFIDVGLALLDQTSYSKLDESWTSLKTYRALFENEELQEANKVIIEGEPGSGKTTLMYYLAYLWCTNDSQMEDVKYFILLPLRRVKHGSTIDQAIMDVLLRGSKSSVSQTDVKRILESENSMVLALDGLDEYPGMEDNDYQEDGVMAILNEESEEVLPDVRVVVTTRPSCLPHIHDCVGSRVKLEKLQDIHWEAYLKKVFPEDSEEKHRRLILEIIDRNFFIRSYCELPLWFTLIVQIMRDDLKKSKDINLTRLTDFFKYILKGLIGHLINKDKKSLGDIESPQLAEIAFNGLIQSSLKQIWDRQELAGLDNYDRLVDIGILVEEEDLDSEAIYSDASMAPKTVTFLHKTFQEWYGAEHLAASANSPEIFTEKLQQARATFNLNLLCFTCGISEEATKKILDSYLSDENSHEYNSDILFHFILEYSGTKPCDLKKYIKALCQLKESDDQPSVFTLSEKQETLLLKSKLRVLQLAHALEIPVNHVDLQCNDLTFRDYGDIITRRNMHIPPLSAKVITVHKYYGQPLFSFLEKCCYLEELRIDSDIFPDTPEAIRTRLQNKKIKVTWLIKKPNPGAFQQWYELIDHEWQCITGKYCGHCDEPIIGLFWECRSCTSFNLCDCCNAGQAHKNQSHQLQRYQLEEESRMCGHCDKSITDHFWKCKSCSKFYLCASCKDKESHEYHSLRLGREFDDREVNKLRGDDYSPISLPFVKMLERERYKVLCSGCKETNVTVDGFECETCVNFNLCERCKAKVSHEHKLKKRNNHLLKGCIYCIGKKNRHRVLDKRYKGFGLCEQCWHQSVKVWFLDYGPPNRDFTSDIRLGLYSLRQTPLLPRIHHEFQQRYCRNCQVGGKANEVWFQCKTCPEILLCGTCKDEGRHNEHKFIRQLRYTVYNKWDFSSFSFKTPSIHEDFQLRCCENCKVGAEINQVWFRCTTCPYFLLCGQCKDNGIHEKHKFNRQYYPDVNCEDCGIPLILIYRCKTCDERIICIICQVKCNRRKHSIEQIKETEIYHKGFKCNHYRGHQIFGTRYKCTSCTTMYNCCEACKAKDAHSKPHVFKEDRIEYTEICSHCKKEITGLTFKCKSCSEYRLCEGCNSKKIHREHKLREIHEKEVHNIGVKCKECFYDVYGSRFRCSTCSGYEICRDCKDMGRHSNHTLMEIKEAELYHDMQCDRCHSGIHDIRYKCKKCMKFNVCKYCVNEDISKRHTYVKRQVYYLDSKCSRCQWRMFGHGFGCTSCKLFYICERCKQCVTDDNTCKHEFVQFRQKEVQHKFIHCDLCKEYQFRGTRYQCKTCKWYNLCEICKRRGHHRHHEFEEWKTSQFLPGPSELQYMY